MFNWIKNLFTSSKTSEEIEAPYKLEAPVVEAPVVEAPVVEAPVVLDTTATWPFPTGNKPDSEVKPKAKAKPKANATPKAEPKVKPAAIKPKAKTAGTKKAVVKTAVKGKK